jgi:hypothetical protein
MSMVAGRDKRISSATFGMTSITSSVVLFRNKMGLCAPIQWLFFQGDPARGKINSRSCSVQDQPSVSRRVRRRRYRPVTPRQLMLQRNRVRDINTTFPTFKLARALTCG